MDLYTNAVGMISNIVKLNTVSDNIANSQTTGYKSDEATFRVFEENFARLKYQGESKRIGGYNDKVYVDNIQTNFRQGDMQFTDRNLDVALVDQDPNKTSFFVVERANGITEKGNESYLTRNGHFLMDAERRLSTVSGGLVLNERGVPVRIPQGVEDFQVRKDGSIVDNSNNQVLDTIQIRTVDKDKLGFLEKKYGGFYQIMDRPYIEKNYGDIDRLIEQFDQNITLQKVFKSKANLEEIRNTGQVSILGGFSGEVKSSFLENSNVDMSKEMVRLMESQRGVEANQRLTKIIDTILQKDANDIGK